MGKSIRLTFIFMLLVTIGLVLFTLSRYATSEYWRNLSLNLLAGLVTACLTAVLVDRLLRRALAESQDEIEINKDRYTIEFVTRLVYWFLFETPDWISDFEEKENISPENSELMTKNVIPTMTKLFGQSLGYVYFGQKDSRVDSILLRIIRSAVAESVLRIRLPALPFPINGNMEAVTSEVTDVAIEVFGKVLPNILKLKEIQEFATPKVIEIMRYVAENSESLLAKRSREPAAP